MTFTFRTSRGVAGTVLLLLAASGCSSAGGTGPEHTAAPRSAASPSVVTAAPPAALDPAAKKAVQRPIIDSVPPQFPIADPSGFTSILLGKVVEFREGPVMVDDPASSAWVVVEVETIAVVKGEEKVGDSVHVQLAMSDRAGLAKAIPAGTLALMALRPVHPADDEYLVDPWAGVPKGATRYIAGAAFAAFADGPRATWYPVLGTTYPRPVHDLVPASMTSRLGDALPHRG